MRNQLRAHCPPSSPNWAQSWNFRMEKCVFQCQNTTVWNFEMAIWRTTVNISSHNILIRDGLNKNLMNGVDFDNNQNYGCSTIPTKIKRKTQSHKGTHTHTPNTAKIRSLHWICIFFCRFIHDCRVFLFLSVGCFLVCALWLWRWWFP